VNYNGISAQNYKLNFRGINAQHYKVNYGKLMHKFTT